MEDESIFTKNHPKEISEGLQSFIDSMVEEIVLEGKPFDTQKKYLKKFSENEGLDYDKLEANITTFIEVLDSLKTALNKSIVKLAEEKGRECHISETTIDKLIKHSSQPKQTKRVASTLEKRIGSEKNKFYHKYGLYGVFCLFLLGLVYFLVSFLSNDDTISVTPEQQVQITDTVVVGNKAKENLERIEKIAAKAPQKAKALNGTEVGHEWVDLGLPSGNRWATMNVGATNPMETGSYFSWGETAVKRSYKWRDYKFRTGGSDIDDIKLSKYNTGVSAFWKHKPNEAFYGPVDNRTQLEPIDDAARQIWKGSWRIPTKDDYIELIKYCDTKWIVLDGGKAGIEVTGKNGMQIFLRAGGFWSTGLGNVNFSGEYWTSSLDEDETYCAYMLHFSQSFKPSVSDDWRRLHGRSIRPVLDIKKDSSN